MTGVSGDDSMLGQCRMTAITEPNMITCFSQRLAPQSKPGFPGKHGDRLLSHPDDM